MVKKARRQKYVPAARDGDGRWLCNVVEDCDGVAVQQAAPDPLRPCAGCDVAGAELRANIDRRSDELEQATAREAAIHTAAATRADAASGHEALELLDTLELRAIAERRQIVGAELEALHAAHAQVVDEHTHPLLACDKHIARLPK